MKSTLAKLSPLLFTFFGVIFLGFITWKKFQEPRPLPMLIVQLLMIIIYVGYMTFESKISIKEIKKSSDHDYDKNTMELAALIKISLLFSCLGIGVTLASHEHYLILGILGICVSILGFIMRGKSIMDLGPHYGHRIRPVGEHLHQEGMYALLRHGAYAGTFFIHLGVTIVFLNPISVGLIFAWLGIIILRIKIEEDLLMKDERYVAYAKKTKYRMLPGIW